MAVVVKAIVVSVVVEIVLTVPIVGRLDVVIAIVVIVVVVVAMLVVVIIVIKLVVVVNWLEKKPLKRKQGRYGKSFQTNLPLSMSSCDVTLMRYLIRRL